MKRPSNWPLYFVLYPVIFRICPAPILAIIQEMSKDILFLIHFDAFSF